jgi:hypothetical protein
VYKVLVGRPKERATRKTEAYMGGWDQNGSYGDWLRVAQDRDRCALVNAVMNLRVLAPQR